MMIADLIKRFDAIGYDLSMNYKHGYTATQQATGITFYVGRTKEEVENLLAAGYFTLETKSYLH